MRRRDILRMWSQIVQNTGIEKYTSEEWQQNYEDFWKCMQATEEPYIKVESVDLLLNYDVEINKHTELTKRSVETKLNIHDESDPQTVLRKRMKIAADNELLIYKLNDEKAADEKKCRQRRPTKYEIEDHIPNPKTIIIEEPVKSQNKTNSKVTDKRTRNRLSVSDKAKLQENKATDDVESSVKRVTRNNRASIVKDGSRVRRNLTKEEQAATQRQTQKEQRDQLNLEKEIEHLEAELEQLCEEETKPENRKEIKKNKKKLLSASSQEDEQKKQDIVRIKKPKVQAQPKDETKPDDKQQIAQQKFLNNLDHDIWTQKAEEEKIKTEEKKDELWQPNSKRYVVEQSHKTSKQESAQQNFKQQLELEEDDFLLKSGKQRVKQHQPNQPEREQMPPNIKKTRNQLKKALEEPLVQKCQKNAAKELDSIDVSGTAELQSKKKLIKETPRGIRTRSQCAEKQEIQQANQEQQQLNMKKRNPRSSRKANAMNVELAHMPQKPIDMSSTSTATVPACTAAPQAVIDKDSPSIEPENLCVPKPSNDVETSNQTKPSNDEETSRIENSITLSHSEPFEFGKPDPTYSKANCELEDKFIKEIIELAAPGGGTSDLSQLLIDDSKCEVYASGVEEIDRCLEVFNNKTPSEIDHQIADTSEFFENLPSLSTLVDKTPLELEVLMNNVLNYDIDDDDDNDIISVTTSWDGDEQSPKVNSLEKEKVVEQPVHEIKKSSDETDPNIPTRDFLSYRIPKRRATQVENVQQQEEKVIVVETPAKLQTTQTVRDREQMQLEQSAPHPKKTRPDQQQQSPQKQLQLPPRRDIQQKQQQQQQLSPQKQLQQHQQTQKQGQQQLQQPLRKQQQQPPPQQPVMPLRRTIEQEPLLAQKRQAREVSGSAPHTKKPLFAPPYRLPAEPASPGKSVIPNIYTNECKYFIFGIKCWPYLDGRCQVTTCNHRLASPWEVQRQLNQMKTDKLCDTYSMVLRHGILFRNYFMIFTEVFGDRGMMSHLMKMVEDCGLYRAYSASFLTDIYYKLLRYKVMPKMATAHFMKHLWGKNIGRTCPDFTMQLLRILASTDWFNYIPDLKHLFFNQKFSIPGEFMACLVNDAIAKNDHDLVRKVWELVLFSPFNRNDITLTSAIETLKDWCGENLDEPMTEPQQKPQMQQELNQTLEFQQIMDQQQPPPIVIKRVVNNLVQTKKTNHKSSNPFFTD